MDPCSVKDEAGNSSSLMPSHDSLQTILRLKRRVEDDPAQTLLLSFKRRKGELEYTKQADSSVTVVSESNDQLLSILRLAGNIPVDNDKKVEGAVDKNIIAAITAVSGAFLKHKSNVKRRRINSRLEKPKEDFRNQIDENRFKKGEVNDRMILMDLSANQRQYYKMNADTDLEDCNFWFAYLPQLVDELKITRNSEEVAIIGNHIDMYNQQILNQHQSIISMQTIFNVAQERYQSGHYNETESYCLKMLECDSSNEDALLMLSAVYIHLKRLTESANSALRVIFNNPSCAEAYSNLGSVYYQQESLQEAVDCYCQAIQLKPTFLAGYLNLGSTLVRANCLNDAITVYHSALSVNPNWYEIRVELGSVLLNLERTSEAWDCFFKILTSRPDDGLAINCLGLILLKLQKYNAALYLFGMGVTKNPLYLDSYINLAKTWAVLGTVEESSVEFFQTKHPICNNSNLLVQVGILYQSHGLLDLAITAFKRAVDVRSGNFIAWSHLSNALCDKMEYNEAACCLEVVLCHMPNDPSSLNNLANIKRQLGLHEEAAYLYRRVLELYPQFSSAHSNYGLMLHFQGNYKEALHYIKEAVRFDPYSPHGYFSLGNVLRDMQNYETALQCYVTAVNLDSSFAEAYSSIATIYKEHGNIAEAIQFYKKALNSKPELPEANYQLFHCCLMICDWTNYEANMNIVVKLFVQQLESDITPSVHPHHCMLFPLTREQTRKIATSYSQLSVKKVVGITKVLSHPSKRRVGEKLRIGYVSYDFGNHPTSHLMQSIPGFHNRNAIEVYCYALSPNDGTTFRANVAKNCDHFVDLSDIKCNGKAAERINDDKIHILINLNGYTKGGREEIFALRPAPIQVMWLGYPGSSGAPYMDYIVTDETTTPMDFSDQFTEKLAYMPYTFFIGDHKQMFPHIKERVVLASESDEYLCPDKDNVIVINAPDLDPVIRKTEVKEITQNVNPYCWKNFPSKFSVKVAKLPANVEEMVRDGNEKAIFNGLTVENGVTIKMNYDKASRGEEVPKNVIVTSRLQYGLPENAVIYCNFNQLYKIDPKIFTTWVNILKAVPNSVLWLLRFPEAGEANLLNFASSLDFDTKRIIFSDVAPKEEHVRRGQLADICLDTPLCNGHTTSMDILWAGTPVVTIPGEIFASRVAASQLICLGCPELVADSYESYENIAINLGCNAASLKTVRAKVWEARTTSPLFDVAEYTANLDKLLLKMWERSESGLPTDHITELSYLRTSTTYC